MLPDRESCLSLSLSTERISEVRENGGALWRVEELCAPCGDGSSDNVDLRRTVRMATGRKAVLEQNELRPALF